jgi:hypothetical protein
MSEQWDEAPDRRSHTSFNWERGIAMLLAGTVRARPTRLADAECWQQQLFLESPLLKRRKGDDKWLTSGGKKGATELWTASGDLGVLKRYGRVVRNDLPTLRFAQYTMLGQHTLEIQKRVLWVVQPVGPVGQEVPPLSIGECPEREEIGGTRLNPPLQPLPPAGAGAAAVATAPAAPWMLTAPAHEQGQAAIDVCSSSKFISFQSGRSGEDGLELGAVMRKHEAGGVTLQSSQGDFAEWYKLDARQAPFEEGDVVGFSRAGRITRKTAGCAMLGVISRKAVVEGSAPPPSERHLYDTVAHCGVVPVKLSLQPNRLGMKCECPAPHAGQLLTPSGRHDGTAVLVPAAESVPRVGILLDETTVLDAVRAAPSRSVGATAGVRETTGAGAGASDTEADLGASGEYVLATALVTAPTQTVPHGTLVRAHQLRRVAFAILWLLASLTVAVVLVSHVEKTGHVSPAAPELAPELTNRPSCDCGDHGTQTNITTALAREGDPCSTGTCVCDDGYAGKFCNGTAWRLGKAGQSCLATCADVGLACNDADWGVHSEASMRAAMTSATVTGNTRNGHNPFGMTCVYWSSSTWEGDPSVYMLPSPAMDKSERLDPSASGPSPFSPTCGWQSGTSTSCAKSFAGRFRLCLCVNGTSV